jgi:S1-C subfamily serine protease
MSAGIYAVIAIVLVSFGSSCGALIGRSLRKATTWKPIRALDSAGGSAISITVWSVLIWIVASLLLAMPLSQITPMVGNSQVVAQLDAHMPDFVRTGIDDVRSSVLSVRIPSDLVESLFIDPVAEPDSALAKASAIRATLDSVVRVEGEAPTCQSQLSGSGFVFASHYVLTNAHVVAGVETVGVRVKGKGALRLGKVVYFDPKSDVAVLYVKSLDTKVVIQGDQGKRSDSSVIVGFPGGGKLKIVPARISGVVNSAGKDIYGTGNQIRKIYTLRANIIQGDSGAPLVAADGTVIGMVFATSATDNSTGYALTPTEYAEALKITSTAAVSTGDCSSK